MPVKRYDGSTWNVVAGDAAQGPTGPTGPTGSGTTGPTGPTGPSDLNVFLLIGA